MYQEHYNLPLPSIENFAYSDQNNIVEQDPTQNQHNYNYEYSRMAMYGYRNYNDHMMQQQMQGQHYQNYPQQQIDANQHASICNQMYQQNCGVYDANMIPGLADIGELNGGNRTRHKRSRMSLQKRLLVNARERERMRVLNKAFEALRDALPCYIADGHMAKITTLRLAINYIKALTEVLEEQRAIDLEKEQNAEGRSEDKLSLSNLTIIDNEEKELKNELEEESLAKIETLKLDNQARDDS